MQLIRNLLKSKEQRTKDREIASTVTYINQELLSLKLFIENNIEQYVMKKTVDDAKNNKLLN